MRAAPFKGNIIIWNMPDDFTEAQLAALFDEFGLVLGAKIDRFPYEPGRTARGLVDLAPAKAVDKAIEALDGTRVEAAKLKVRRVPDAPPRPPKAKPAAAPGAEAQAQQRRPLPQRPLPPAHGEAPHGESMVSTPVAPRKPIVEYRSLSARKFAVTR
jgi:hypothetical protein